MAKRPELLITNGDQRGRHFVVDANGLRLGRSSSNDIQIVDEELSRNHCLFNPSGDEGILLTDLVSANGTFVNGKRLGKDPVELKIGDLVGVGQTVIEVVGESVDLGLSKTVDKPDAIAPVVKKRSPIMNILWLVAVLAAGAAIYLVLTTPATPPEPVKAVAVEPVPVLSELVYEKVNADVKGIFRYEMTVSKDGVLTVTIDDVPTEDRHITKSCQLGAKAIDELNEIVNWKAVKDIDREYIGPDGDNQTLKSYRLKLVYSTRARYLKVINTVEPEAFRAIREKLETFAKSELGIWAIQYPREQLIELAAKSVELGAAKWEDRDVNYGNLAAAVAAYREALFYLETISPKPPSDAEARAGLERAMQELERRYMDQRFLADRAMNLSQWEVAKKELQVLMEMIPDTKDDRHRDAKEKLLNVEKQLTKGGR